MAYKEQETSIAVNAQRKKQRRCGAPAVIYEEPDLACGMIGYKPPWLQLCNNIKVFLIVYVCLGIFKGTVISYFGAVLPSMERRFGFKSTSIGIAKAMRDVSEICVALLIGHFGGAGHRPRWIAGGSFLVGLGFLLLASTEIMFPVTENSLMATTVLETAASDKFCMADNVTTVAKHNDTCGKNARLNHQWMHDGALSVLSVAEFLIGLGTAATIILGTPFVDDNVKASNAPIYYAISFSGQIFGPLLGLGLAAVFNTIFFNFSKPDLLSSDPRWISAWFLGFIVSGVGTCIFAVILSCFPSAIPRKGGKNKPNDNEEASQNIKPIDRPKQVPVTFADLPKNLMRLGKNTTYLLKLTSQLINGFVLSGFLQFGQKFMKEQYQLSQSAVNLQGGLPPIFGGFIGTVLGGYVVKRFQLAPRHICYLMAVSSIVGAACYFGAVGLGCDRQQIVGIDDVPNPYNISNSDLCSVYQGCNCKDYEFDPVCDYSTRTTIVNSCVAGCKASQKINATTYYFECSCTGNDTHSNESLLYQLSHRKEGRFKSRHLSSVRDGICPVKCPNFVIYVALMSVAKLAMGIPMAGMVMLQFRIVDYDLKSLANSVSSLLLTLFGFLPAPIIFGKLIDSSCHLWQTDSCGTQGACWLYRVGDFRWKLHTGIGVCRLINLVVDLMIAYRVRNLSFDRDKNETELDKPVSTLSMVQMGGNGIESEQKGSVPQKEFTTAPLCDNRSQL
ncbi:solute carrier organic anion transporter family member 4C1-like [Paramacrobiotus metropolitanus]|uniref:solute carrier organic anion transporter family member 4C1-like n=1 Tax=Paramacrobiotus metropolitanus TaxID=2943436 RepID=UPI002445EB20|nr:solute carrier organic anion transporter family member 4C1-like [Paramacrobiotus metropolitanus]